MNTPKKLKETPDTPRSEMALLKELQGQYNNLEKLHTKTLERLDHTKQELKKKNAIILALQRSESISKSTLQKLSSQKEQLESELE